MNETSWFLSELDTMHIAMPYQWIGNGYSPYGHYGYSDYPAGQLRTSINQLGNFLLCYMNGGTFQGQQILNEETVDLILTPQVPQINPMICLIWAKVFYQDFWYWGHGGGDHGVSTSLYFRPEDNTGAIILTNADCELTSIGAVLFNYAADSMEVHCLPDGITFSTQEEIDNFQTNYPYCTEIEGNVEVNGDDITNLYGLTAVTAFGGDLHVIHNDALISLTGLENLTSIDGTLQISGNDSLSALSGLDNISPASIVNLFIYDNNSLATCEVESICEYLIAPSGIISIHDNASGCNSQLEVEEACDTTVIVTENATRETFIISPNPLESTSVIKYTIPIKSTVTIKIFDLTGVEIKTLVNKIQLQGKQQIIFNNGDLPSGIYFCVLKTNNGTQTKKIIKL